MEAPEFSIMQSPLLCETAMPESRPESQPKSRPGSMSGTRPESTPKPSPEAGLESGAKSGAKSDSKSRSEARSEARSESGSEFSPEAGSNSPGVDARLEKLELKLMDMEMVSQQLNDVVLQQYHDIEKLRNAHGALQKQLDTVRENADSPSPADEVPPHY
jgi:uncharacterized coiled-coil protein SlyX